MKKVLQAHTAALLLLIIFLLAGLFNYQDYGIAWDEAEQRTIGTISYNYIAGINKDLEEYYQKDHGAGYEMLLIFLERKLNITDSREMYQMRHIVTHLLFLFSAFCGYLLAFRLFNNKFIACLGFIILVMTPRIYAHSFFNSKDIPFLSVTLISMTICAFAFLKNKTGWFLLLGIVCGYSMSIRIIGFLIAGCIMFFFLLDLLFNLKDKKVLARIAKNGIVFFIFYLAAMYVCLPAIWIAPIDTLIETYRVSSKFTRWGGFVLFLGVSYPGTTLPWFYAPLWIMISTPLVWLVAGVSGIIAVIFLFIKKPLLFLKDTVQRNFLLYIVFFFTPLAAVIILHSVLLDDWRHLYFIYPSFVMLALFGINQLLQTKAKKIVQVLCITQIGWILYFMIDSHPHQQIYFNELISHKKEFLRKNFDFEYWGSSTKQGFEYILKNDTSAKVPILWSLHPIVYNVAILPEASRNRIELVDRIPSYYYFLTNFRGHPDDYPISDSCIFYEIKKLGSTILRVYKIDSSKHLY